MKIKWVLKKKKNNGFYINSGMTNFFSSYVHRISV